MQENTQECGLKHYIFMKIYISEKREQLSKRPAPCTGRPTCGNSTQMCVCVCVYVCVL